jgi:hypothetical protein
VQFINTPRPATAQAQTIAELKVSRIERAFDALLDAIAKHRPHLDAYLSPFDQLLAGSVGCSLRVGLRRIGKRPHMLGGVSLMRRIMLRVADGSPRRLALINHAWRGVGGDFWPVD